MHFYENWSPGKTKYEPIREFCLCEKVDVEYMRSLIRRDFGGGISRIVKKAKQTSGNMVLLYGAVVLLLLVFQTALGKAGKYIADSFSYVKIDPHNAYAWNFAHHITVLILALFTILILSKPLKSNFGLCPGDTKTGLRYAVIYTAIFAGITLAVHILMAANSSLPVYAFPLNKNNIFGSLCFQLFLSGPAEELLFRALPITILMIVSGKSVEVKGGISPETIIAAFLFAIAHIRWSLSPFAVEADYFQLIYAFAQGIVSGKAYQDTRSVFYPMFMHSISNVLMVGTGYLFFLL